jgi:hypothetical protein
VLGSLFCEVLITRDFTLTQGGILAASAEKQMPTPTEPRSLEDVFVAILLDRGPAERRSREFQGERMEDSRTHLLVRCCS